MASSVCPVSRTDSDHNIGWHICFMGPDERIMGKNDKHNKVQTMDIFLQMFYFTVLLYFIFLLMKYSIRPLND